MLALQAEHTAVHYRGSVRRYFVWGSPELCCHQWLLDPTVMMSASIPKD